MFTIEQLKEIDLRIAEILEVKEHPNADRLYVLQIQVGEEKKQIIAGIREHYSIADLIGRKIVIINNLEPAVIRGEESNGMLLAASDKEKVVILCPDKDIESGSKIK